MPNSSEIKEALKKIYCQPEWILGFEVPNATGGLSKRRADAVAMNLFPSKNYEIRGFEIKISKSDLKRDLGNGQKSNEVAKYCDYWFLVTPKGLTNDSTLPATWGVIEFDWQKLRQKVKPQRIEKVPMTASFAAALLQTQSRVFWQEFNETINTRVEEATKEKLEAERHDWEQRNIGLENNYHTVMQRLNKIKEETGIDLINGWFADNQIEIIKAAVKANDANDMLYGIQHMASKMKHCAQLLEEIGNTKIAELSMPEVSNGQSN